MFNMKYLDKKLDTILNELNWQVYKDRNGLISELKQFNKIISQKKYKDKTNKEIIIELFNDVIKEIDNLFSKYSFIPGINLTTKINDVVINYCNGYTNYTKDQPLNINTMFDVASISKTPTAIMVYQLIEHELINLETKVKDILIEFNNLPDELLITDMLQYKGKYITNGRLDDEITKKEALKRIKETSVDISSLNEYNYNDIVPILCGLILERVTGKNLNHLTKEKIIKPLNLMNIGFTNELNTNNITGTPNFEKGMCNDPKINVLGRFRGSAGIFSSTNDMISIMENTLKGKLFIKNLSDFYTRNPLKVSRGIAGQSIVPTEIEKKGYFSNLSPIMSLGEDGSTRTIATSGKYVLNKTNYYVSSAIFTNPCSSDPEVIKYYEKKDGKTPGTYYKYYENIDAYRIDARGILPSSSLDEILFTLQKFNLRVSLLHIYINIYEKDYKLDEIINIKNKTMNRGV